MIKIYRADTASLSDEESVLKNLVFLDGIRRQKVCQCRNLEDKKRSLLAGYLIQAGAKEWMTEEGGLQRNAKPLSLSYIYSEYGKPYLKGKKNLYFNISHSRNYVVCAFSNQEVGIDIQVHRKEKGNLVKRFFPPEDQELMERLVKAGGDPEKIFFRMWAVKEAYMKLTGEGLRQGLDKSVIEIENEEREKENADSQPQVGQEGSGWGKEGNSRKADGQGESFEQGRIRKKAQKKEGAYFKIYEEYDSINKYSMAVCSYMPLDDIQKKEISL